jgi:hypothetical protein
VPESRFVQAVLDRRFGFEACDHRVDLDQPDLWTVIFFPGSNASEGPWSLDIEIFETELGIDIGVTVDGSPWGIETGDDLRDSYQDDYQAALTAQEERQQQAIETLQPLRQALQAIVNGDGG